MILSAIDFFFVDMQLNPTTKSGWDATKQKQCPDGHTGDIQETLARVEWTVKELLKSQNYDLKTGCLEA